MAKLDIEKLMIVGNEIEDMVEEMGIDVIDACILYCEQNGMEIESLGEIVKKNQSLRAKVQREAEALNFIKPEPKLELEDEEDY